MTEEDARRHLERVRVAKTGTGSQEPAESILEGQPDTFLRAGPKFKSKWEERFAELLDIRIRAGELRSWVYEGIHLRLPGDIMYRVDFIACTAAGELEAIEVKGRMREPARIKLRQAIERYPQFKWFLVRGDMIQIRLYAPKDVPSK